jgi:heterodisulfide reductase subunit A
MAHVLVVGGGLAGCTAALELEKRGQKVTIIEKTAAIGGKVREFGCKATERCSNCGVCLAGGLWETIEKSHTIDVLTETILVDVTGSKGNYNAVLKNSKGHDILSGISSIIVAIGFERPSATSYGNLEINFSISTLEQNIISGFELEKLLSLRSSKGILPMDCSRVAFIQCFGSRDIQGKAPYCSRVCCGYSTRAAKTLKYYHPDIQITFFYMDLQYIEKGNYFDTLIQQDFEFIKSMPVKIESGNPVKIVYENPKTGLCIERDFDLVVLSEGMHPSLDTEYLAELCVLDIDERGFLKQIGDGGESGIYISGCASGPKRIEEVYAQSLAIVEKVLEGV